MIKYLKGSVLTLNACFQTVLWRLHTICMSSLRYIIACSYHVTTMTDSFQNKVSTNQGNFLHWKESQMSTNLHISKQDHLLFSQLILHGQVTSYAANITSQNRKQVCFNPKQSWKGEEKTHSKEETSGKGL